MRKLYVLLILALSALQLQAQLAKPDELVHFRAHQHRLQQEDNQVFISALDEFGGSFIFVFDAEKQEVVQQDWAYQLQQPLVKDDEVFLLERRFREYRFEFQVRDTGLNLLSSLSIPDSLTQRGLRPFDAQLKGDTILYAFGVKELLGFYPYFSLLRCSVDGSFIDQVDFDTNHPFSPVAFIPKRGGYWVFAQQTDTTIMVAGERSYHVLLDLDDTLGVRTVYPIEKLAFPGFLNPFDLDFERVGLYQDEWGKLYLAGYTRDGSITGGEGFIARINYDDSSYSEKRLITSFGFGKTTLMNGPLLRCNENEQVLFYNSYPYHDWQNYQLQYPESYVTFSRLDDSLHIIEEEDFFFGNQLISYVESAVITDAGKIVAVGNERDSIGFWRTFIMTMDCEGNLLSVNYADAPERSLRIFPNPTSDICSIQSPGEVLEVRVLDLNGREVLRTQGAIVDLGALPTGLYALRIQTTEGIYVEQVLRQ